MWKWVVGVPVGLFALVMLIGYAHESTPEGAAFAHKRAIAEQCENDKARQLVTNTRYQLNCDALAERAAANERPDADVVGFTGNMEVQAPPTHYERMQRDDPHFVISQVTHKQWQAKCKGYLSYDAALSASEKKQMPSCEQEWRQLTASK